jgi:hypothetical protein
MSYLKSIIITAVVVSASAGFVAAQKRTRTKAVPSKTVTTATPLPNPTPVDPVPVKPETKRNERPTPDKKPATSKSQALIDPTYFYEFSQPEFDIKKIVIEHDDSGRGTITFTKRMFGDTVTDPITVSPAALERINAAYLALNFIDSRESYQYEKDYSHLGVMTFKLKKGSQERTAVFNFTVNKDAKALADEYRKLANQFIWMFDISVARENQPLESPRLLDALDGLLRRNEISDPSQMMSLLNGMRDDERIPLIARNHAAKLVERIGKANGKR